VGLYCVFVHENKGFRPSGGMADAGDLKSPARSGRVGSNPTSAIDFNFSEALFFNNVRVGKKQIVSRFGP
jgi:hypothetical protein